MINYVLQQPDGQISEKLKWTTDVQVSDNGTEQRISITDLPKRTITGSYAFEGQGEIRRHLASMLTNYKNVFYLPYWQWMVKLKAKVFAGGDTLQVNSRRSQFKVGDQVFIVDGGNFEINEVEEVNPTNIRVVNPLLSTYTPRTMVVPIKQVYANDNASVTRKARNNWMTASFNYNEYGFIDPFVDALNNAELNMFNGLPLLDKRGVGTEFQQSLNVGNTITDYGGVVSIRDQWDMPQWQMPLTYKCNRVFDYEDLNWWFVFLDYCKGSTNPFYLPTYRDDFEIFETAVGTGNTIKLAGHEYRDTYWPYDHFKTITITGAAGVHYATVTGVANSGGNDQLTFTPALPAGDWITDQEISLLLKCRVADDSATLDHDNFVTNVTLNIRTVP